MKQILVEQFGSPEVLRVVELPTPVPAAGEVLVKLTSIGMNHAELMARRGTYKLLSGEPPFVPGLEGGGVIEAVGASVKDRRVGQRVVLAPGVTRTVSGGGRGGAYRTHYLCLASDTLPAPDAIPDDQLGTLWLPYLTAWGCLVWKQKLRPGQIVALPAASSSVALAAAQIINELGGVSIGMTSSPAKVQKIRDLPTCRFDHLVLTRNEQGPLPWHKDLKRITQGKGVDVFFDPVAAGHFLASEILCLAQGGTVWVYGLLGEIGPLDVTPLIRKKGAIRGWALNELTTEGGPALEEGCRHILDGFANGTYQQHIGGRFKLEDARAAHEFMEKGEHLGKLVLVP